MTGGEERALLGTYLTTCARLERGLRRAAGRIEAAMPVTADTLDALTIDDEDRVLAFLKRFEQFEDALGRTLKTVFQLMALGRVEHLTPRDVANRAEGFGIVTSAEVWADAVRARNALAHEYPLRPDKRARQVNDAWVASGVLYDTWASVQSFVNRERLAEE